MGAADVVPGVSGGTIALITGIYDRFIDSLRSIGTVDTLKELSSLRLKALIERIDGMFLLSLFAGIFTSFLGLASLINTLMELYPHPVWASFLGLVLACAVVMFHRLRAAHSLAILHYGVLLIGLALALVLGRMTPQDLDVEYWHFFAGGAIAICAMILPGISGSFLLLMMGLYSAVLTAITSFDVVSLMVFASGCGLGLLSFSHLLSWCLRRFPVGSHMLLIGLMLGSVEKLWPWKETLLTRVKSSGEVVPLLEQAISPFRYEQVTGNAPVVGLCALAFCSAFLCILVFGSRDRNRHE